ncbi:MinD/ParA family protein [Streptomyces sp. NPDC007875]|uniref:MinD/ParA family ATP-binding protein n=1 Tax=Streptomyces sp. NPDC007875 TaxID=3364783 RepID=UPI003676C848
MSVVALVSATSDGVTTSALALALASPRPTLLAECDLSGGSIRSGYLYDSPLHAHHPLDSSVGLHTLAQADWARANPEETLAPAFDANLRQLDSSQRRYLLPGITDPRQAASLASTWPTLAELLQVTAQQAGYDVIVDAGRLVVENGRVHPVLAPAALLHQADLVLLVVRARRTSVVPAQPMLEVLRAELAAAGTGPDGLGLLVVTQGGHSTADVSRALQTPVMAQLSWDERTAGYLEGERARPRGLDRTPLMRDARTAARNLREWAQRRRLHLQLADAQARHPAVAGVLQRLTHGQEVSDGG